MNGKTAIAVLALALVFCVSGPTGSVAGEQAEVYSEGTLKFTPVPEVTVCFCGSFFLSPAEGYKPFYLVSDEIDLTAWAGQDVHVAGRQFAAPCHGTLLVMCQFMVVSEIGERTPADTAPSTWGAIKELFGE